MDAIVSQRSLSVHKEHELLLSLEKAGLNDPLAQKLIDSKNNDLARRVVTFIEQDGQIIVPSAAPAVIVVNFEPSESQKKARTVMGRNYLGIEEAMTKFGVRFTADELAKLAEIPANIMSKLEERKNDYLLVAGYPLSMLDVRTKPPKGDFASYENAWYNPQRFAGEEKPEVRWYFVRKLIIPGSLSTEWSRQKKMIPKTDEAPDACVQTYAQVLYYLVTGEKLQKGIFVRTNTVDSGGSRVDVGWYADGQFNVSSYWHGSANSAVGVGSLLKSDA